MGTRKVLISPGYGAGWSTWAHGNDDLIRAMLFDEALIAAVEQERKIGDFSTGISQDHPAVKDFVQRMKGRFGDDGDVYLGGLRDIEVVTVEGQFRIEEYDGSESIMVRNDTDWY